MRKVTLTWTELQSILRKQTNGKGLMPDEEIKEITLMKPKEILIRAERE
jgi:hypothetical protein